MTKTERTLGFWSALTSAALAVTWFVTYSLRDLLAPVPAWQDLEAYAAAHSPLRTLYIYPSLLLALTFLVLLVCIHRAAPEDRKVWSLTALSFGIVYSVMATVNYTIQAVAVRLTLASGDTAGVQLFLPDNTNGVFTALANSYVYMALAMVAAGFVFGGGRLATTIRALLWAQAITAVGQLGWSLFGLPMAVFIATSLIWVIGAPLAFVLIALLFRRGAEATRDRSARAGRSMGRAA